MANSTTGSLFTVPVVDFSQISSPYLFGLALLNLPVSIILLNAFWQLVQPRDRSLPPVVFHWLPFIGSAGSYGNDPINFLLKCRKKYGDVFTFIMFGRKMTVALGAKGNHFILGGKLSEVSAEEVYHPLTTPVFGKGVVYDVPNSTLMEQKKFVKFGLSVENFKAYVPMIVDEIEKFLDTDGSFNIYGLGDINEWGLFNARDKMSELIILTASRTLQGREVRESLDKSFAQRFTDLDAGFVPINMILPNLPLEYNRKRDRAQQEMSDFYVNILKKRDEGHFDHEHDMLAALSQQCYKNGNALSKREIAHIMIALLMAGQHTSSATSSWALLHLADQPDVQEAVYEEQEKYFGVGDGKFAPLDYGSLQKLPILNSVIRETLRVHPPIHSILRKVIGDMVVPPTLAAPNKEGTYVIPKGHYVLASPAVSQLDPDQWKDSNTWEPSRWTDPDGVASRESKKYDDENGEKVDYGFGAVSKGTESIYQPFGAGRHRCIGEQFAYLQLGVIIATFVRNMEMRIQTRVPDINFHTMITLPKNPAGILYRRRHLG